MRKIPAPGTESPQSPPIPPPSTNGKPKGQPRPCYWCGDRPAVELPVVAPYPDLLVFCSTVCAARAALFDALQNLVWCETHADWHVKSLGCSQCDTESVEHKEHMREQALAPLTAFTMVPQKAINAIDRAIAKLGDEQKIVACRLALKAACDRLRKKGVLNV